MPPQLLSFHTRIQIENTTTSAATYGLLSEGLNPAMLIMANRHVPGGKFTTGANTQEESTCKQSNLYEGLNAVRDSGHYPIPELGVIFAPAVTFFKNDKFEEIRSWQVNVIASAAYDCNPNHTRQADGHAGYDKPANEQTYLDNTKEKMRAVMRAAAHKGNDSLVLSAFGCGAFNNEPNCIANLYKEVLEELEF